MIVDLMNWDMQEKYQSQHDDGYISYLLFKVKLHANKISVKCTGYASGNILVNYSADKAYSASYNIVKIYRNKPANINKPKKAVINALSDENRSFMNGTFKNNMHKIRIDDT